MSQYFPLSNHQCSYFQSQMKNFFKTTPQQQLLNHDKYQNTFWFQYDILLFRKPCRRALRRIFFFARNRNFTKTTAAAGKMDDDTYVDRGDGKYRENQSESEVEKNQQFHIPPMLRLQKERETYNFKGAKKSLLFIHHFWFSVHSSWSQKKAQAVPHVQITNCSN